MQEELASARPGHGTSALQGSECWREAVHCSRLAARREGSEGALQSHIEFVSSNIGTFQPAHGGLEINLDAGGQQEAPENAVIQAKQPLTFHKKSEKRYLCKKSELRYYLVYNYQIKT